MNLGCLNLLTFGLFGRVSGGGSRKEPPYGLREHFLSAAEISFYHVLRSTLAADVTIAIKPRIADILYVKQRRQNQGAWNRISQKHVDFLLCETATMKPRLAIELDDRSHQSAKAQARDALVDDALRAAGLPILHIRAAKSYGTQELFAKICEKIAQPAPPEP